VVWKQKGKDMGCCSSSEEKEEAADRVSERTPINESKEEKITSQRETYRPLTKPPNTKPKKASNPKKKPGKKGTAKAKSSAEGEREKGKEKKGREAAEKRSLASQNTQEGDDQDDDWTDEETAQDRGKGDEIAEVVLPEVMPSKRVTEFFKESDWTKEQIAETKALFDFCDSNRDGVIGKEELRAMFRKMNILIKKVEFEQIFRDLDRNGNEEISFEEFLEGIQWLQKGATLDHKIFEEDDDETLKPLKQKLAALSQYAGLLGQNVSELVEKALLEGDTKLAKSILEVLDIETLSAIQDTVSAKEDILPKKTANRLNDAAKRIK